MKHSLKRKSFWLCTIALMLGVSMSLTACGGNEGDENKEENNNSGNNEEEGEQTSVYTLDQFIGIWTQTQYSDSDGNFEVYDDPNDEWGITFQSDKVHGRYWHLRNGGVQNFDFKWWLGSDIIIHILEFDSGNEFVYEATFMDRGKTLVLYNRQGSHWSEEIYVKN